MGKDYYKTLGVDKGANQEEIKKAFRKKAHEFHPDKSHGDEAKFKEANEAYQVLSNKNKRAQYDQFGSDWQNGQDQSGFSGFSNGFSGEEVNINMDDLGDIFSGIGDIFGFGGGGRGSRTRQRRGEDIQAILTVDFMEAVFGDTKEIALVKNIKCSKCSGQGAEPGTEINTCKTCQGSGQVSRIQRTILGNIQTQTTCPNCQGEGKAYERKCFKCSGTGITREEVKLNIKIPAGIDNGETIRLSGQGGAGPKNSPDGDLYLKIIVREDKRFERDEYDIRNEAEINFSQAALGDKIEVATVDGFLTLKIPEGTQSGTTFKLRGKGIAKLRQGRGPFGNAQGKRGDHLVKVIVKTPTGLNRNQKKALEELGV